MVSCEKRRHKLFFSGACRSFTRCHIGLKDCFKPHVICESLLIGGFSGWRMGLMVRLHLAGHARGRRSAPHKQRKAGRFQRE